MSRIWYDEPREMTIDLGDVSTPWQLRAVLSKHFDVVPDILEKSCVFSLGTQDRPYRITFRNWVEFRRRMPRRARLLKGELDRYARWHPQTLVVDYGAPEKPRTS